MANVSIPDDLSVVILTYNRPQQVTALVDLIPPQIETIVADDGTLPNLRKLLPTRVKFYTHEHHGNGASACRNAGARLATQPKILFLDDDVTPHGLCYGAHSLALDMYDVSLGLLPRTRWQPYTDDRLLFYVRWDQVGWNWTWSGNLAVRATTFWEVGGFDEISFTQGHGFEDKDLGRRLWLAQKSLVLNQMALAHHPNPHTASEPSPALLKNQQAYQEKWGEP